MASKSLNQAKDLYGDQVTTSSRAWRNTLAFRGILDKETLELLSFLCGTYWKEVQGWSESTERQDAAMGVDKQRLAARVPALDSRADPHRASNMA